MLRLASRIIVVGSIILVLVLVVGGCVLEELQWQQMMHPNWPKQETAGAEVDRAVGAAVDRYEAVLDAQWGTRIVWWSGVRSRVSRFPACRKIGRSSPRRNALTWSRKPTTYPASL